jgi:hypothetical protein
MGMTGPPMAVLRRHDRTCEAARPRACLSGRAQRVNRRRLDKAGGRSRQIAADVTRRSACSCVSAHELGVVRCLPPQLIRDLPRRPLEHLVAEEANLQRVDPRHPLDPLGSRDLTPARRFVQRHSACERTSVGARSLCSAATISPAAIRSSVSQSTTNRVTAQALHAHRGRSGRVTPEARRLLLARRFAPWLLRWS